MKKPALSLATLRNCAKRAFEAINTVGQAVLHKSAPPALETLSHVVGHHVLRMSEIVELVVVSASLAGWIPESELLTLSHERLFVAAMWLAFRLKHKKPLGILRFSEYVGLGVILATWTGLIHHTEELTHAQEQLFLASMWLEFWMTHFYKKAIHS